MNDRPRDDACFTDFALQEYVAGRLDPEVRAEVEAHAGACELCRRSIELLAVESAFLRQAFITTDCAEFEQPVDPAMLALYLDGALDPDEAASLEHRLTHDPEALMALTQLQADVAETISGKGEGVPADAPSVPAGEILRMPKRTQPPAVIRPAERRFGGGTV